MSNFLNTKIGILGGGQLGKMLIESYSSMNLSYTVLEKAGDCPASLVCDQIVEGSLYDENAISELASRSDVLTIEIEHLDVDALERQLPNVKVIPQPQLLRTIQDKGLQKEYYSNNEVSTLPYELATSEDLASKVAAWSEEGFVLKHRKGGYDGKGVQLLTKLRFNELHQAGDQGLQSPDGYVIEALCKDAIEVSVIVAVDQSGNTKTYAPAEMVFDPAANLMDYLISPSQLSEEINEKCRTLALKAVKGFDSPGLFAVELFVKGQNVYVNEIAPRPHNSGHHSIESCYTSQYEQLNRILLNLPLGSTDLLSTAITVNILGPDHVTGAYYVEGLDEVLAIEGVYVHMYGKKETKPYRKIGHYTILGQNREDCISKMNQVRKHLRIEAMD